MDRTLYTAYLDESLKLSKEGVWYHNGAPFTNEKVAALFFRSVQWNDEEERYYLVLGGGRATFQCEDTAYFVVELLDEGSPWSVRLSDESAELLRPQTLTLGDQNQVYCLVKGDRPARFSRSAHQRLMQHVRDDRSLIIDGVSVALR